MSEWEPPALNADTTFPGTTGSIFLTGRWYPQQVAVGSAVLLTVNHLYLIPFVVGIEHTFTAIGINSTVAGTGNTLVFSVYADDGAGYPGALVYSGSASGVATGLIEVTAIAQTLTPGLYWLGVCSQGGTVQTTVTTAGNNVYGERWVGNQAIGTVELTFDYVLTGVSGAMPNPCTAGAAISAGPPCWVAVSA